MKNGTTPTQTIPSNRMTHGLTSKAQKESWFPEAELLAKKLIGDIPTSPEIVSTAIDLAMNIILLKAVRQERLLLLSPEVPRMTLQEMGNKAYFEDTKYYCSINPDLNELETTAELLRQRWREHVRVDEYERKALSRRKKLVRKFDCLVIEARRRESGKDKQ